MGDGVLSRGSAHGCASTSLWDRGAGFDTVSLHSLRECPLSQCRQCLQFLRVLSVIFDQDDLPQDLTFSKQRRQPVESSLLWDVMPRKYGHHIQGIEILLPSDQGLLVANSPVDEQH